MLRKSIGGLLLAALAGVYVDACSPAATTKTTAAPDAPPLAIDAALENRFVKAGAATTMTARIALSAKRRTSVARPPVNLALVVDTSGSMEGKPIEDARAAALKLFAALAPEDHLAVVVFHSKAEVLLPSTRVADADMSELRAKISAMKAQGTTEMADGLRMGVDEVVRHLDRAGVNRVLLLGDGVANDDTAVLPLVSDASTRGISVTTLGLGDDYDETLMAKIAQTSGGKFHHVDDSNRVGSFFAEEVTRLHQVVARGAMLYVRPGPGVTVTGCVGRPGTPAGRGIVIPLGDLTLGDELEIVCDLAAPAAKDGAHVEVLDADLHYQEGVGGGAREDTAFAGAKATIDPQELSEGRNAKVEAASGRARDAMKTILQIQQQRALDRANIRNGIDLAPSPAPATPAAAAPPPPREQLRMNDEALHRLGY